MSSSTDVPNASSFLAAALPWPDATDPNDKFFINIHRRNVFEKDGKPLTFYGGKACTTVQEAANYIAWANTLPNEKGGLGTDTYVCMSGQSQAEEKLNAAGRKTYKAIRKTDNALWFKGLWIDVDVKPDDPTKGYPDSASAVRAFTSIRSDIGLPVPTVLVMSGSGGFHAHWCFSERIAQDRWEPAAGRLVAAFLAKGFHGDTGCTIDGARLLRVPDTGNYKDVVAERGGVKPVRILGSIGNTYSPDYIEKVLAPFQPAVTSRSTATGSLGVLGPKPAYLQGLVPDTALGAGIDTKALTVPIVELAKICPFVARSMSTGGAANNQPQWHTTCRIATFTDEERNAAHWMAQGHPGYSVADTDAMFDRVAQDRLHRDLGWPQCAKIAGDGAPECPTCPHLAAHKSPFNHYQPPQPAQVSYVPAPAAAAGLATLPVGYSYGLHNVINKDELEEDGKIYHVPVTGFVMLEPWIQDRPAAINFSASIGGELGQPTSYIRQIRLPLDLLHEASAMGKELARQQLVIPTAQLLRFREFVMSWQEQLRKDRDKLVQSVPFGWYRNDGKIAGFIYGKQIWNGTMAPRPASNPDPVLEKTFKPTGKLEPWTIAAKMTTDQGRPELDVMLASAFAAPLVALVGQTGLLMSTYSAESGIGKSTTMRIAQAVWGHPTLGVQSLGDTANSVVKRIGDLKNLPMYWDELKSENDVAKFVSLAFQLAQGKEKSRMSADTSYREVGTWETMLVSTSNDSLMGHIIQATRSTNAGLMRVFEFVIKPPTRGLIDPSQAQLITAALNDNFGCAGLEYAQFLGSQHEKVTEETRAKLVEIEKLFKIQPEERFWLAQMTVIIMGAKYANLLGLTTINESALQAFMFKTFQDMRTERQDQPVDLGVTAVLCGHLARYMNAKRERGTIITNYIHTLPGRPPIYPQVPNGVNLLSDPTKHVTEVVIHLAADTNKARFIKRPFTDWLEEMQVSDRIVIKQLMQHYGVNEVRGRLAVGTKWVTQQEAVLDLDFNHPAFKGLLSTT